MSFGIRSRFLVVSVGIIVASFLVAYLYVREEVSRTLTERIGDDLVVRAQLAALSAEAVMGAPEPSSLWDAVVRRLAWQGQARVTLIRRDGVVLAESGVAADQVGKMADHADRPEFQQALAVGRGQSVRLSSTVGQRLYYAAVPFRRDGQIVGVARLAVPLTEVDLVVGGLHRALWIAGAVALLIAVIASSVAAQIVSRTALSLVDAARRMADGDLSAPIRYSGQDEFGQLGRSLDQVANTLSATIGRVREERDRLSGILAGMQEGVLVLDGSGRIALVNPALREMLLLGADAVGQPPEQAIGQPELIRLLTVAQRSKAAISQEVELTGLRPRIVLVQAGPLADKPGSVFCVFLDVTDMRRLESMRRDFVANVSHELRTPVTSIRSAAETLQGAMTKDPEAAVMFVDIIDRNAARLHALVEDLLDLSRIESRELDLHFDAVDLRFVFEQVMALFRERADKKRIGMRLEVPEGLPPALADPIALENVLTNLVDNAVKYCGPGSEVVLRARQEADRLQLLVTDSGPGIAPQHLPRLFERFYRVDTGRSRELGGTGLGLAIVKHLVEALGGAVQVESELGVGTRFSFTLRRGEAIYREPSPGRSEPGPDSSREPGG